MRANAPARPEQTQFPQSNFEIPQSWRAERPAKPSITATPDLFWIAGTRAAELWLKTRPTAQPGQWRRQTFDNLVAGLGRIAAYTECLAAFERGFKRRIVAATRTIENVTEVRA